jgi:hypothetical protein
MVLRTLVLAVLLFGCKQSLFDSHGGDDDASIVGGGDGAIASTCPAPCLGDAGANFDGTAMGSDGHWSYVEDHKDHTWQPMTASGDKLVGAVAGNEITSCKNHGDATACAQLPGALLISTAGGMGPVSAVEWISPSARVVQLQLGVRLPDGGATQTVRLYRGSREDALFTATADPGVTVQKTLTLDVLSGERIYVTFDGPAVTQTGVQLFVVGDMATFPSTCQIAVEFDGGGGPLMVDNLCGADFTFHNYDTSMDIPPAFGPGPYTEEGMGGSFATGKYFDAPTALDRTGDFTVQYWMKFNGVVDSVTGGWPFSDLDLNNTGGLGMVLFTDNNTNHLAIEVSTCSLATQSTLEFESLDAQYPDDQRWHFVRVVHSGSDVALCVDGTKLGNKAFQTPLKTTFAPYLGKNVVWTPSEPSFNGLIDDLRVVTTALPCN